MRIIDADKLLNQIEQHCIDDEILCKDDVIEIIDNAPTVIPEDFMNPYEEGYEKARKEFERPTGKWQVRNNNDYAGGGYYFCNKCNQRYSFGGYFELDNENFCPNCGADMKGAKK